MNAPARQTGRGPFGQVGYTMGMTNSPTMQVQPRPPIRALFVDIDGTLAGASDTVSPGVREAIKRRGRGASRSCCVRAAPATLRNPSRGSLARPSAMPSRPTAASPCIWAPTKFCTGICCLFPSPCKSSMPLSPSARNRMCMRKRHRRHQRRAGIIPSRSAHRPVCQSPLSAVCGYYPDLPFEPVSINAFGSPAKMRPLVDKLIAQWPPDVAP